MYSLSNVVYAVIFLFEDREGEMVEEKYVRNERERVRMK